MSNENEQWAKEVSEILGYWFDCNCAFKLDISDGNGDYIFNLSRLPNYDGYYLNPTTYAQPLEGCVYLSEYFVIDIKLNE